MNDTIRYLITTADERTWKFDQPIIFLGEWCRLFDRRHVWEKLDAVVSPYHWDDRKKLYQDYLYLQSLYESVLEELAIKLNNIHGVNLSVRYWRILVGPWLGYFIQMVFDRWYMLRQVLRDNGILEVCVIQRDGNDLIPNDMDEFISFFVEDDWNEMIYGKILEWMSTPVTKIKIQNSQQINYALIRKAERRKHFRLKLNKLVNSFSSLLSAGNDYFFSASYIPFKLEWSMQVKLGQVPTFYQKIDQPSYNCVSSFRDWTLTPSNKLNITSYSEFITLIGMMIPRHIPCVYLEGYKDLVSFTEKLPFPKRPKVIFTSNSYSSDEVFKAWAALKVENGSRLVLGQHGGNYGISLWCFSEEHQIAISDRFLTWGWDKHEQTKITPVGNFKDFNKKAVQDLNGVALMVENTMPRYSYHMYSALVSAAQCQEYFNEQYRFVEALPEPLRERLLVRLYPSDYGYNQKRRWQERFTNINLDEGVIPIESLLKKTRLYISTYNATTYLESLSLNIPSIIFWNPKHWELRESAIPYFEKLKSVGIFHETPECAAKKMVEVWEDIEGWWQSVDIQNARKSFCAVYAASQPDLMNRIKSVLVEEAKCSTVTN